MGDLHLRPVTRDEAKAYVRRLHRHHAAPVGDVYRVGVADQHGELRGVAVCGRPVARALCDGRTIEVTRVCTDGAPNACSMLYGACRRAATALGWRRGLTYLLDSEDGASVRAAGLVRLWDTRGGSWDTPVRRRQGTAPECPKVAWGWGDWSDVKRFIADQARHAAAG